MAGTGAGMVEDELGSELAVALFTLATEPARVPSFHKLLASFNHEGRNLLNSIKLSLYLARREDSVCEDRDNWASLDASYRRLELVFDRIQTIYRPMSLSVMRAPLGLLLDDRRQRWVDQMAAHERPLELAPPRVEIPGQYDPVRLGEALDAFIAWRAGAGRPSQPARLAWRTEGGSFQLDWQEIGTRREEARSAADGGPAALALPLLARVVTAHGGALDLSLHKGLELKVRWPLDLPLG